MAWTDVVLRLRDLGSLERLGVEGVSDLEGGRLLEEELHELVVDALLHEQSGSGSAELSVVLSKIKSETHLSDWARRDIMMCVR